MYDAYFQSLCVISTIIIDFVNSTVKLAIFLGYILDFIDWNIKT